MKILLYPHGGSGNHGCEAIVRSTLQRLQAQGVLMSSAPEEDAKYGLDTLCDIRMAQRPIARRSWLYAAAQLKRVFGDRKALDALSFRPVTEAAGECDVAFSIGGDNYCYDVPEFIYLVNRELRRRKVKTVLWGCSIEPASLRGRMLDDLRGYDHIYARESVTSEALLAAGLRQVTLRPDPAFALRCVDLPLPDGFVEGNTVGVNVSPMILGYEKTDGLAMANYERLVQHIIDTTNMQVALIPHVVWAHNDDRVPLTRLYERYKDTGRVVMIEDHNAEELKGYIARCRFMVVARTHASIAAYSQQVPTLVVGYSVKARGIAKDLFGTDERYVMPVQSLRNPDELVAGFEWLCSQEQNIRTRYVDFMPQYLERLKADVI